MENSQKDFEFYGKKADFLPKNNRTKTLHYNNKEAGIDTEYTNKGNNVYYKSFPSSESVVNYFEKNPLQYTEKEKKEFSENLDKIVRSYKETKFSHFVDLNDSFEKLKIEQSQKNLLTFSHYIPMIDTLQEVPTECLTNPFYYISENIKNLLLYKSKTITEVYCGLSPLTAKPFNSRDILTGKRLESLLQKLGICIEKIINKDLANLYILFCKMEEPYEDESEFIEQEDPLPEIEKIKLQQKEKKRLIITKNVSQPIVQSLEREITLDTQDIESIDEYARSSIDLRIVLKEITKNSENSDAFIDDKEFVFVLFFFCLI